jgi:hypothetical protein
MPAWAWLAVATLSVAITVAGASRAVLSRWHSEETGTLTRLVADSESSEQSGNLGQALSEIEAAISLAIKIEPAPGNLEYLRRRRDQLARREAEASLKALTAASPGANPGQPVGRVLTLLARACKDPALAGLEEPIRAELERLRLRWAEADAAGAMAAFQAGRLDLALEQSQRQFRTAEELGKADRKRLQADATALASRIIAMNGAIIEPIRGQFTLGSPASYAALLTPIVTPVFHDRGYLPCPTNALWADLWAKLAPFRLSTEVVERQDDQYLSSPNRLSQIEATLVVSRSGEAIMRTSINGRTQIPLPGLSAYQASRLAVGDRRSPDFEHLLYENARALLLERLGTSIKSLPECHPPEPDTPRSG